MKPDDNWPYIVIAPHYRESSLGIQVVHRLCHLLNESGQQAWLNPCEVNSDWNTPVIPSEELQDYIGGNKPFIAVYPEVVSGNPLNAPVVVRYMLNREGVIAKNSLQAKPEDLFFWYRPEFAGKTFNPTLLALETYDLSLFCDDRPEKDLDLLYINRVPEKLIDFSRLPAGIRILSMQAPLPLAELAPVLKRGRVLYTFESSGTCFLANLCGCPVVALTLPGYEHLGVNADTLRDNAGGICWDDDPRTLTATRLTLPAVRQGLLKKREKLDRQLEEFISLTQARAKEKSPQFLPPTVSNWLEKRRMTPAQQKLTDEKIAALAEPATLLVIIRNTGQDGAALETSLSSLIGCRERYPFIRVLLTATPDNSALLPDWVSVISDDNSLQQAAEHWVQVIDAGVRYYTQGLLTTALSLHETTGCFAVFADELTAKENGELETALRPDFNLDLVLSLPWLFARRWLFRLEAVNSIMTGLSVDLVAWELETITRLIEQRDISGIGHISEPLLIVPQSVLSPAELEAAVIQRHLGQRGYSQANITLNESQPLRISYGETASLAVSVVVLAGDNVPVLQRCIALMAEKTSHDNYEIIIARDTATRQEMDLWLNSVAEQNPHKISVVTFVGEGNQAELYNLAVNKAKSEFVVLLTTRTMVVQNNWLSNLLNHAQRPETGCVGCKIISLEQSVLSAGEIIGGSELCGAVGYGANINQPGYMQRLQSDQNYTLMNSACLLIKKEAWQTVGGLDQNLTSLKQMNIDLSLKLRQAGYMSVWTPYSVVASDDPTLCLHNPSSDSEEGEGNIALHARWLGQLARDPAYNDNFSSVRPLFTLEMRSALFVNAVAGQPAPVILGMGLTLHPGEVGYHAATIEALNNMGAIVGLLTDKTLDSGLLYRIKADAIIISEQLTVETRRHIALLKDQTGSTVNLVASAQWIATQARNQLDLTGIDQLIVQNKAQAEAARQFGIPAVVLPRQLSALVCLPTPLRRNSDRLRVLCNTCELSDADIELVTNLIRESASVMSWQIVGPLPASWEPWIFEHYRYPGEHALLSLLASIDTDLAIVPRADNKINRLKDHFILLELAACGIPALVSDVGSLQCHIPVLARVRNRKADWTEALRRVQKERENLAGVAGAARQALREADWLNSQTVSQPLQAWLTQQRIAE